MSASSKAKHRAARRAAKRAAELADRKALRERLARVLHNANTGSIVPDNTDPTKYVEMADAVLDDGWIPEER